MSAAIDVLGYLPGPALPANAGACDLLAGEVFAYAVGSGTGVVDVRRMQLACVLQGRHRGTPVTAVSWCPECHSRELAETSNLRLASGDSEGRVVVWDVAAAAAIAALEDPAGVAPGAAGSRAGGPGRGGAVRGLAWVLAGPAALAVALSSGHFLIWDPASCTVLWRKDFGGEAALGSVRVDPRDARRAILTGDRGQLSVLSLTAPERGRVEVTQYSVDVSASKPGDAFRAAFSCTRDLLFVLMPREVIVFDLEFGQPAASTPLPKSRPAFRDVLGCFGHRTAGRGLHDGGVDLLYLSHQDGSVSVWRRAAGALSYVMLGLHRLVPPPSRPSNNATLTLLACTAGAWVKSGAVGHQSTIVGPAAVEVGAAAEVEAEAAAAANVAPGAAGMQGPPILDLQRRLTTIPSAGGASGTASSIGTTLGASARAGSTSQTTRSDLSSGGGSGLSTNTTPSASEARLLAGVGSGLGQGSGSGAQQASTPHPPVSAFADAAAEPNLVTNPFATATTTSPFGAPLAQPQRVTFADNAGRAAPASSMPPSALAAAANVVSPFDRMVGAVSAGSSVGGPPTPFGTGAITSPFDMSAAGNLLTLTAGAAAVAAAVAGTRPPPPPPPPPPESLLLVGVTDDGHVWQWDLPLHALFTSDAGVPEMKERNSFPSATSMAGPGSAAALARSASPATRPALLGLLSTLAAAVTTFSACPVPVAVAAAGGGAGPPSGTSGRGGDAAALLAAVTAAGTLELITLQRGVLTPLAGHVAASLGAFPATEHSWRWETIQDLRLF
ncbi:hypothetical protein WJX81_002462 [Elliptochloris bilobata]|uniref:WDR11 first beta-propeller domain-containing protein n=1 Tax=Elliptochloris bilobata TaxID=381761 RepID=A0AAW1SHK5_9CHLO